MQSEIITILKTIRFCIFWKKLRNDYFIVLYVLYIYKLLIVLLLDKKKGMLLLTC